MNNGEREQWIMNDEGLYNWWKSSRVSLHLFIRENREELDRVIAAALHRGPSRNPGHPPRRRSGKRKLTAVEQHELNIALSTIRYPEAMRGVMGGPTLQQARATIDRLTAKQNPHRRIRGVRNNPQQRVAITVKEGEATYGWIITKDYLNEKWKADFPDDSSAVGTAGPRNINDEVLARLRKGEGQLFKMYDDDGELYYTGRFIGEEGSEEAMGPLDDFGTPDSGAVRIDYRQANGKWETL